MFKIHQKSHPYNLKHDVIYNTFFWLFGVLCTLVLNEIWINDIFRMAMDTIRTQQFTEYISTSSYYVLWNILSKQ